LTLGPLSPWERVSIHKEPLQKGFIALVKGQALAKGNFLRTLAKGCGEESPCKRVHVYRKQPLQKGVYRMQPLQVVYRPVFR